MRHHHNTYHPRQDWHGTGYGNELKDQNEGLDEQVKKMVGCTPVQAECKQAKEALGKVAGHGANARQLVAVPRGGWGEERLRQSGSGVENLAGGCGD